jgi:hypothetical protein
MPSRLTAGAEVPGDPKGLFADCPGESDRRSRSEQSGEQAEHSVLDQGDKDDQPPLCAEGLENRRFVEPVELGHGDRADQDQQPTQEDEAADEGDGERDVADDPTCNLDDVADIDGRDVREAIDQLALEPCPVGASRWTAEGADVHCRRVIERSGAKDDQKAGPGVAPVDLADAGYAGGDPSPEHIEGDPVTDVEPEFTMEQLFDRDLRVGWPELSIPEAAGDDPFVRLEAGAVGRDILATEQPAILVTAAICVGDLISRSLIAAIRIRIGWDDRRLARRCCRATISSTPARWSRWMSIR